MIKLALTFAIGVLFSVGFGLAGITRPETIVNFLDFASASWSPAIILVMGAAAGVTLIGYRLVFRRGRPLLDKKFYVPTRRDIDGRLVAGAVLFGAGWGLIGFCPGPALASIPVLKLELGVWLVSMVAGMMLFSVYDRLAQARAARKAREPEAEAPQRPQTATQKSAANPA